MCKMPMAFMMQQQKFLSMEIKLSRDIVEVQGKVKYNQRMKKGLHCALFKGKGFW